MHPLSEIACPFFPPLASWVQKREVLRLSPDSSATLNVETVMPKLYNGGKFSSFDANYRSIILARIMRPRRTRDSRRGEVASVGDSPLKETDIPPL
jgi:hypothetical protein